MLRLVVGLPICFTQPRAVCLLDDFFVVVSVRTRGVRDAVVMANEVDCRHDVNVVRLQAQIALETTIYWEE